MFPPQQSEYTKTSKKWSASGGKRTFDIVTAFFALVLLSPLMLLVAALVRFSSKGPVLFRQTRMGMNGRVFEILKFRSMRPSGAGPAVTKAGDARLTLIGGLLRKCKFDELPQLFNVLRGDMSLVGPRPKLPHHQTYTLRVRPGVTGAASLAFRNEEYFLHHIPEHALDACQINVLVPLKRELDEEYMLKATLPSDVAVLFRTIWRSHKAIDTERIGSLQDSLLSLSQALGKTVAPISIPPSAHQAASKPLVRDMAMGQ